jgi:ABC-type glycerol-3-phosphate transport system permease component
MKRHGLRASDVIATLVIFTALLIFLAPVLWMLITAIKPPGEWPTSPPVFVPSELHWENFTDALFKWNGLKGLTDSLIVAVSSTVLSLLRLQPRALPHRWRSVLLRSRFHSPEISRARAFVRHAPRTTTSLAVD